MNWIENEKNILSEIGNRIKQRRIKMNITQEELARRCRMSTSTEVRIENGEDTKWSNIVKIMCELGLGENFDALIPDVGPDYKKMYEGEGERKRASKKIKPKEKKWVWGEDK